MAEQRNKILRKRILPALRDSRTQFVVLNVIASLLVLLRSFIAMRVLGEADLGRVTLIQTIVLVVGFFQLGLMNGGYRLLCNQDAAEASALNRIAWLFMAALTAALAVACLVLAISPGRTVEMLLAVAGVVTGLVTLARTWVSNQLIALGDLRRLNVLTILSAAGSLVPLAAIPVDPLLAVVVSLLLQPLLFFGAGLWMRPDLKPSYGQIDLDLAIRALAAGFALFFTGLLLQVNIVVERSFVVSHLGLEQLGRMFLLYLYISLFQLVPTSLDAIFLRRIVATHRAGDPVATGKAVGTFLFAVSTYCLAATLATLVFAEPLLQTLVPERTADLEFVWLLLPGLLVFTLAGPLAVMFNVLINYRAFYLAYGGATALTLGVLLSAQIGYISISLTGIAALKGLSYGLTGLVLVAAYALVVQRHPAFKPRLG